MRKRRGGRKTTRRKAAKTAPAWVRVIKHFIIGTGVVIACLIGGLFIYDYFFPIQQVSRQTGKEQKKIVPKPTVKRPGSKKESGQRASVPASSTKTFQIPARTEIPQLKAKRKEQIIRHEGYTVSYNSDYRIANWVAYELTASEAKSQKTERSNKFVPDPKVKGATATNEDYTRTGYDRGHLAPAGDMKWSAKAMRESFYLSNICPQKPKLNRGIWKELEEQCRLWAMDNGKLLIATGPVITDDMKRLGKNRVAVPNAFYKVICYHTGKEYKGIAFLFENRDYENALKTMAIPIDSVERVTGIDFFPSIPDKEEKAMEATVDSNSWSF